MPAVEFVADDDDPAAREYRAQHRRLFGRLLGCSAALALVAVAALVVGTGGGGSAPHIKQIADPSPSPSATANSLVALPASTVFGPDAVDVLAVGNRVFALTSAQVGVAERDAGTLTIRPAPSGLADWNARLVPDIVHRIIWVVAIGDRAIGAYDTDHLDTLGNAVAPYRIRGAVAMDEVLYFTTDHGLYSVAAGEEPHRVPGPAIALSAVAADLDLHEVLAADAADARPPDRVHILTSIGGVTTVHLPVARVGTMAVVDGKIWLTGASTGDDGLFVLDPAKPGSARSIWPIPQLRHDAAIAATFGNRLIIRSGALHTSLYCVDTTSGGVTQQWTAPQGSVTLNQRGLLVATDRGIAQLNARDCLAA